MLYDHLDMEVDKLLVLKRDDRSHDFSMGTGTISKDAFLIVG